MSCCAARCAAERRQSAQRLPHLRPARSAHEHDNEHTYPRPHENQGIRLVLWFSSARGCALKHRLTDRVCVGSCVLWAGAWCGRCSGLRLAAFCCLVTWLHLQKRGREAATCAHPPLRSGMSCCAARCAAERRQSAQRLPHLRPARSAHEHDNEHTYPRPHENQGIRLVLWFSSARGCALKHRLTDRVCVGSCVLRAGLRCGRCSGLRLAAFCCLVTPSADVAYDPSW